MAESNLDFPMENYINTLGTRYPGKANASDLIVFDLDYLNRNLPVGKRRDDFSEVVHELSEYRLSDLHGLVNRIGYPTVLRRDASVFTLTKSGIGFEGEAAEKIIKRILPHGINSLAEIDVAKTFELSDNDRNIASYRWKYFGSRN